MSSEFETEIAYVIPSDPTAIFSNLREIKSIGEYKLCKPINKRIKDTYFDFYCSTTKTSVLEKLKLALRLRENKKTTLTLKGPGKAVMGSEFVQRLELEEPWSRDALIRVVQEINQEININLDISFLDAEKFQTSDPKEIMYELGFKPIQTRETIRELRELSGKNGKIVA